MITEKEVQEIIIKSKLSDVEMLAVIRKFIWDKKGIDIKDINRPNNIVHIHLMNTAFERAAEYYGNKE